MRNATIRSVNDRNAEVSLSAIVSPLAVVGAPGEWRDRMTKHPAVIHGGVVVREFAVVHAGCERPTVIGPRTLVMTGSYIGHDTVIGADCEICPGAQIMGLCEVGDGVQIGAGAVLCPRVKVGANTRIGAGAVVTKDTVIGAGETWVGIPARRTHVWKPS